MTMLSNDILVLPPNPLGGGDKVIGDLHGNLHCLRAVMDGLGSRDRLFIVGDLIDRGEQSADLILSVMSFQHRHPEQLYSVMGNHELLCIRAIAALETMVPMLIDETYWDADTDHHQLTIDAWIYDFMHQDLQVLKKRYPKANIDDLRLHIINGGAWLVYLFRKEIEQKWIDIDETGRIKYEAQSALLKIKQLINSLPYIIHVAGKSPFNIVHADMPLNDLELSVKCTNRDFKLTREQREYAVWARADDGIRFKTNGRDNHSTRTFVGHSMIAFGLADVLRNTNTVNLDVATYRTNLSLVVNHQAGTCEFVGPGVSQLHKYQALQSSYRQLNQYLQQSASQHISTGIGGSK